MARGARSRRAAAHVPACLGGARREPLRRRLHPRRHRRGHRRLPARLDPRRPRGLRRDDRQLPRRGRARRAVPVLRHRPDARTRPRRGAAGGDQGRRALADRLRGQAVRLDGGHGLRALPRTTHPAPRHPRPTGSSCRSAWSSASPPPGRPTPGSSAAASRKPCDPADRPPWRPVPVTRTGGAGTGARGVLAA